ncbi:phosphatidylinositol-glycan biosynthesis class W protein-like [Spodoptera frugiperda]|uniref:Phosphatidylinositol-glycan biosynthesis class W protein n=1 Tax=Spodoptera frugiperda TaxID=7108 RepID=A0A9R0ENW2_SPOFR|nr:phosphatidylinositol-glycan biosynthesis class W protein-like [Spodoptera frugiperda]
MNASEYKKYHESFMQNNHGSTAVHTCACIFFTVQCAAYLAIKSRFPRCCQFAYEYLVMVLPMIVAHTLLAEYIYILNLAIFIMLLINLLLYHQNIVKKFMQKNVFPNNRVPLISCLRGLTYLITGLCILAVDFQDFPRYLAKTERFGYSLMDTGVGLFVIMSGVVHKDLRTQKLGEIVKGNFKIISVLVILGIGRYVSVKQLNYQEHVTEYGVHWNFFFTIAVCKVLSTIVLYFSNNAVLLCILSLVGHELSLYMGLQDWVFGDTPRDSLISANREGISSCLGYVSIYLFGVCIKNILLNRNVTKYHTQIKLILGTVLMWSLTYFVHVIRPASRTLANAGYCLYIDTLLVTMSAFLYYITVLVESKGNSFKVPVILSHINTNGLSYFLIANLLTGAVNLSMRTLLVPSYVTFIILNIHMIVSLTVVVYLKVLGVKI